MPDVIVTDRVCTMELSKILGEGENIIDIIAEEGLPAVFITNKKMYKILLGQGINQKTGKKHNATNQVVGVFDFSKDHPIFQNTYNIVRYTDKKELKILTYSIMDKLYSILNIYNYLQNNWNNAQTNFLQNRNDYDNLCKALPQIPMLKEYFDAFCVETKDAISYILTLFKVYCKHQNILDKAINATECIDFIKEHNLTSLENIFNPLQKIDEQFRDIRNAVVHPENYKDNSFLLYNIYLSSDNVLMSPFFEYRNKEISGSNSVLEYVAFIYNSLLDLSKQFLSTLV